ncbi:FAD-dependent monooxygenase [Sphingobium sp. EM0848]|uniref:FAD-dependent monooxygenase n=1 Tax=Sphingobium sp. EM0848 TaxID=2743473 RepID=UPI00159C6E5A
MSSVGKVLVVGGGISGLSVAIALRRHGTEVDVAEKYQTDAVLGIGIILQGNALRALDALGIFGEIRKKGYAYDGFAFFDSQGQNRTFLQGDLIAGADYPSMMGITRPDYGRILTEAAVGAGATIWNNCTITDLVQDADGVDVIFTDGRKGRYDAVIGADGIHSVTRKLLFGTIAEPYYSGQAAWRVNYPRQVDELQSYTGENGDRAGVVPLSDTVMYMYVTDKTETPVRPAGDLREVLRTKLAGYGGLIGKLRDDLPPAEEIVWKPFLLVDLPPPWHKGRVIIIGDAAHASSAHLGQGGAMAIEDAVVLGEELGRDIDLATAFRAFMDRRLPRASKIKQWSEQLCRWEIERSPNADHIGVTRAAFELIRQPI